MSMPTTIPGLFNANEAADYLGVSGSLIRRLCRQRRLKALRFGISWAIEKKELDRFRKIERPPGNPHLRNSG